jgi:hypothetical protein
MASNVVAVQPMAIGEDKVNNYNSYVTDRIQIVPRKLALRIKPAIA